MRLFFAVDLADEVKALISEAIRKSSLIDPPWRWVGKDNLHITLKFLGEMREEIVPDLIEQAGEVSSLVSGFPLEFREFGAFPSLGRPRVLFYSAGEGEKALKDLAEKLDSRLCAKIGIARERRPFKAHVTLARIKRPLPESILRKLGAMPSLEGAAQRVERIVLMQSKLRREGALYIPVKEIALRKKKC